MKAVAATVAGGVAILVGSFWLTLKIIDGPQFGSTDLELAIAANGFTVSKAIAGAVDTIQRDPNGRLILTGWALDKERGQPVTVLLLVGEKFQQIAATSGPRPDVTAALNLTPQQTQNIAFAGFTPQPLGCGPHTIVAVNQSKQLAIIGMEVMVPRCSS